MTETCHFCGTKLFYFKYINILEDLYRVCDSKECADQARRIKKQAEHQLVVSYVKHVIKQLTTRCISAPKPQKLLPEVSFTSQQEFNRLIQRINEYQDSLHLLNSSTEKANEYFY